MKYLEAKQDRRSIANKMLPGPSADKSGAPGASQPRVRPDVRALSEELGVDLSRVTGTGKNGAITMQDVRAAVPQTPPTTDMPPEDETP